MTEPQKKPDRTPTQVWLEPHLDAFKILYKRASEAADTTGTPAWTANYRTQRKLHEQTESGAIKAISSAVETMQLTGTNEESEKEIKDAVKTLAEERIRFRAWEQRAVEVYRKSATDVENALETVIRKAREKETENPLIERGFEDEVRREVATWGTAKWDEEVGAVVLE